MLFTFIGRTAKYRFTTSNKPNLMFLTNNLNPSVAAFSTASSKFKKIKQLNLLVKPGLKTINQLTSASALGLFTALLGMGWGSAVVSSKTLLSSYSPILHLGISPYLKQVYQLSNVDSVRKYTMGSLSYKFNASFLWRNFLNFTQFLQHMGKLKTRSLMMGSYRMSGPILLCNWASSGLTNFEFLSFNHLFFFSTAHSAEFLFQLLTNNHPRYRDNRLSVLFLPDILRNKNTLREAAYIGARTVGVTSLYLEPWLLWYPVFCDGDNLYNQVVFSQLVVGLYISNIE